MLFRPLPQHFNLQESLTQTGFATSFPGSQVLSTSRLAFLLEPQDVFDFIIFPKRQGGRPQSSRSLAHSEKKKISSSPFALNLWASLGSCLGKERRLLDSFRQPRLAREASLVWRPISMSVACYLPSEFKFRDKATFDKGVMAAESSSPVTCLVFFITWRKHFTKFCFMDNNKCKLQSKFIDPTTQYKHSNFTKFVLQHYFHKEEHSRQPCARITKERRYRHLNEFDL